MPDVNMPKLSDTMEEGTIVEWKKKTGDEVKAGEVLAEVESDKATFDLEAESDGVLSILVEQGVPAKIGAPIATIGEASAAPAPKKAPPAPAKQKEPEAPPQVADEQQPAAKPAPPKAQPQAPEEKVEQPAGGDEQDGQHVKASPLAKRLAAEMGVDIASLKGSGPDGRIVKADVLAAAGGKTPTSERRKPVAAPRAPGPDVEVIDPTRMQATIARRMTESKSTVPEFTVTVEARVDEAVKMRQQLKDSVPGAEKVTMTDMLVRASALALRKFPEVNTSWVDGRFQRKRAVNIGLAVAPSRRRDLRRRGRKAAVTTRKLRRSSFGKRPRSTRRRAPLHRG